MRCYLGVDHGGTTTKAALYDQSGHELCCANRPTELITPAPGFCERSMEAMWRANCEVIREVIQQSGIDPHEIAAVSICGHGKGLYLWGKSNRPVRNGIASSDNRAQEYLRRWREHGISAQLFNIICQQLLSCHPAPLLAWLRDNEPETVENTQYIFSCKDYIRFCMTGEAFAEITDCSGSGLLNLHTKSYDERILQLLDLTMFRDCLPPLKASSDLCGYVTAKAADQTGLIPGTPVAGGMFDIDACALAVNAVDPSKLCMIAGTWSINEYVRENPILDGTVALNSIFCDPQYYLIEESSPTSAGNNQWYIDQLLPEAKKEAKQRGQSIYSIADAWCDSLRPDTPCPIFLPFIMGSNVHSNAKGSIVGISSHHTRAHITRSIYEGIAFSHRYHLERLLKGRALPPDCIHLAGGAAHSAFWAQMFADVCKLPVRVAQVNETGALGCAINAAVCVGDYPSYREAAAGMVRLGATYYPRRQWAEAYDKKYQLYRRLIDALNPIWPLL